MEEPTMKSQTSLQEIVERVSKETNSSKLAELTKELLIALKAEEPSTPRGA